MPYFNINIKDRVIADGQPGVVIALGSVTNKSANYFVRLDSGKDIWFSREEVIPEAYQKNGDGGKAGEADSPGSKTPEN